MSCSVRLGRPCAARLQGTIEHGPDLFEKLCLFVLRKCYSNFSSCHLDMSCPQSAQLTKCVLRIREPDIFIFATKMISRTAKRSNSTFFTADLFVKRLTFRHSSATWPRPLSMTQRPAWTSGLMCSSRMAGSTAPEIPCGSDHF